MALFFTVKVLSSTDHSFTVFCSHWFWNTNFSCVSLPVCQNNSLCLRVLPGLRIRLSIGSGFNRVLGSGSVFRIRIPIQEGKTDPQKSNKCKNFNACWMFFLRSEWINERTNLLLLLFYTGSNRVYYEKTKKVKIMRLDILCPLALYYLHYAVDIFQIFQNFQRHLPSPYFSFGNVFADFQDCFNIVLSSSVADPWHIGVYPDPRINNYIYMFLCTWCIHHAYD